MSKNNRIDHEIFKEKLLRDPEVLAAYHDLEEEFMLMDEVLKDKMTHEANREN